METEKTKVKDWKEHAEVHYSKIYSGLDPKEMSARCNIPFDSEKKYFSVRLMGTDYKISFPKFEMYDSKENPVKDEARRVLVLRYLCESKCTPSSGRQLSYREIPWGDVYFKSFEGRCIKRIARTFGADTRAFNKIFETHRQLNAEKLAGKECGWRFEFINGLFMSIIIWLGDDEFPTSAQILFDDNFPAAFSAEDIAVLGEIAITDLKALM